MEKESGARFLAFSIYFMEGLGVSFTSISGKATQTGGDRQNMIIAVYWGVKQQTPYYHDKLSVDLLFPLNRCFLCPDEGNKSL